MLMWARRRNEVSVCITKISVGYGLRSDEKLPTAAQLPFAGRSREQNPAKFSAVSVWQNPGPGKGTRGGAIRLFDGVRRRAVNAVHAGMPGFAPRISSRRTIFIFAFTWPAAW